MARIRTVKPEFFRHEKLFEAEIETQLPLRVAFAGLWTAADREGRFKWVARQLKLDCLPYDELDFSRVLDALVTRGFIVKYGQNGEFGHIPSWNKHQIINNRERPSELPNPLENNNLTRAPRVDDACPTPLVQVQGERKGREGEGKGKIDDVTSANGSLISQEAYAIDRELILIVGHDPEFVPPAWHGAPWKIQSWLTNGWPRDAILSSAKVQMAQRGNKSKPNTAAYFEKGIADFIASNSNPLPIGNSNATSAGTELSAYANGQPRNGGKQTRDDIIIAGMRHVAVKMAGDRERKRQADAIPAERTNGAEPK